MIICLHDNHEGSHDHLSVAILAQVISVFFFKDFAIKWLA